MQGTTEALLCLQQDVGKPIIESQPSRPHRDREKAGGCQGVAGQCMMSSRIRSLVQQSRRTMPEALTQ